MDYNNTYYYNGAAAYALARKKAERADIRFFSAVSGLGIIAYVAIQNVLGLAIGIVPALAEVYSSDIGFQCVFGIFCSVLGVLLPFAICSSVIKSRKKADAFEFGAPKNKTVMLLILPVAFMLCLAANYVTSYLTLLIESAGGVKLLGGEYSTPDDAFGKVLYAVEIAIIPPLCEEFAVRGVVMQPLRRYGDRFAIIASALVFAVMHGNLVQAPFAFIVGMVIGYAVCVTGTMWTGVLIHFMNNGFSALLEIIGESTAQNVVYYAILLLSFVLAGLCGAVLILKYRGSLKISSNKGALTGGEKGRSFMFTVPMVIAFLIMLWVTSQFIEKAG